jgi:hypothetical protein
MEQKQALQKEIADMEEELTKCVSCFVFAWFAQVFVSELRVRPSVLVVR